MIGILWGLFQTLVVRSFVGRIVAAVLVGFVALGINNALQRQKGAAAVIETAKEHGRIANAKNEKVRERARQPGAADRLLKNDCRDC